MKKKIVIFSAFFTPFRSGAESCAEEIPQHLKEEFDFVVITAKLRGDLPTHDAVNGISVIRLGFGLRFDKYLYPFLAPFAAREHQPDIIHAILESYAGLALILSKWIVPKAKQMLTCQSTNTSFMVKSMHDAADRVTVISNVLKNRAQKFGKDAVLIPNGLNLHDVPSLPKESGLIVFVGRLESMKGIDTLLKAFAKVSTTSAKLRIVGEGSQRSSLEKLSKDLGIQDRVTFVGFKKIPDVYEEFARAEIFCGLSRSEALGNVFIEAQMAGCAVVGTNVGGIPDIITNNVNGMLVPADNPEAATNVLNDLLSNSEKRRALGEAGKQNAAKYDWSLVTKKYADQYNSL